MALGEELTRRDMDIEKAIAALTEQMKAAFKRIDEQKDLVETVHRLAVTMEFMAKEQARQATEIEELKAKPAKRWEAIVGQAIGLLVAAAAGGAIMKLFGG